MFHTPFHKVPADQPQAGQIVNDPRLALVVDHSPYYVGTKVKERTRLVVALPQQSANSEFRNDRRAYP